jgi:hypothetical protein
MEGDLGNARYRYGHCGRARREDVSTVPLERQSKILSRGGARIAPSTLGDWYAGAADLAQPLCQALRKDTLGRYLISLDDRPGSARSRLDAGRAPGGDPGRAAPLTRDQPRTYATGRSIHHVETFSATA